MPHIQFWLDDDHYGIYKEISNETKKAINAEIRDIYNRKLDKAIEPKSFGLV